MGRPTDKASSAFRHPRGGGLIIGVVTTPPPDQVGGVGIGPTPEKSASHWSNGFLLTSWLLLLLTEMSNDDP